MFNENTKPRALLLLRVSTAKQANGNDDCLLPVQQEKCVALCEQNGWEIVGTINETKSAYKNSMMIPMLTPLNATIMNVILCIAGGVMLSTGLGAISNQVLKKTSLV